MDAAIHTLKGLFSGPVSYRIPVFQRPYAWNKEKQWKPLWSDIQRIADQLLVAKSKKEIPPHFMGAIVLQFQSARPGGVVKRIVVDGQQRLTTLQLLIRAAQESFQSLDDTPRADRMSQLIVNDQLEKRSDFDDDTKVRQSNLNDLQSFQDVIRGLSDTGRPLRSIGEAYQYFVDAISGWLDEDPANREARAEVLETILTEYLQIATVDLDEGERPHFIFSVLNARAETLKQSDHIKNTVMYEANVIDDANKANALWGVFDANEWWRSSTNEGRISRIHLDRFLNYWVIMRTRKEVNADSVSAAFDGFLESNRQPIEQVATDIREAGRVYKDLEEARTPGIESFLRRVKAMEIGVVMPILMWLYTTDIPDTVRKRSIEAIESYLVRRMLSGISSQGLNKLFVELLEKAEGTEPSTIAPLIIEFLGGQTVENRIWPKDAKLKEHLIGNPLRGNVGRQTMVLTAIESEIRSGMTEPMSQGDVTREHIMPQKWEKNWPLPAGVDEVEATEARHQAVRELGNLTLVTGALNSSLSNEPWDQKVATLRQHTALRLNWELLEHRPEVWDEGAIRERSGQLAEVVTEVWPFADNI